MTAAAWAWVVLALGLVLYVAGFDWYAQVHGIPTMSEQIHQWMQDQLIGPVVVGLLSGIFGGLLYHFAINK